VVIFPLVHLREGVALQLLTFNNARALKINFLSRAQVSQQLIHAVSVFLDQLFVFLPHC
jgi:hypothetical protein